MDSQIECKIGYFGQFCNISCPPGAFGKLCGGLCSPTCTDQDCDHIIGCVYKSTDEFKSAALTKLKTTEQIYVQSSISFKETTMSLTKASLTYTSYILMGVGAAIFILLFIIVIQLCKRSKSARMSNSDRRTHDASNELRELHVRNMKPSNKGKFNQSVEAEFYQIDEQCEMEHSPAVLRTSQKYKRPCLPQKPEHLCTPLAPKDNYQCHPLNVMYADNLQEASDKNNSDLYLQPFLVHENIHTDN